MRCAEDGKMEHVNEEAYLAQGLESGTRLATVVSLQFILHMYGKTIDTNEVERINQRLQVSLP